MRSTSHYGNQLGCKQYQENIGKFSLRERAMGDRVTDMFMGKRILANGIYQGERAAKH